MSPEIHAREDLVEFTSYQLPEITWTYEGKTRTLPPKRVWLESIDDEDSDRPRNYIFVVTEADRDDADRSWFGRLMISVERLPATLAVLEVPIPEAKPRE